MKITLRSIRIFVLLNIISSIIIVSIVHITKPFAEQNTLTRLRKNILSACGIPFNPNELNVSYNKHIIEIQGSPSMYFYKKDPLQSDYSGTALLFNGSGFWAPMTILIAVKKDGNTITGLRIIEHNETPGLGGRIDEEWFINQFKNKKLFPKLYFIKTGKATRSYNEVDAITGATMTCRAVERLINIYSKYFKLTIFQ